MKNLRGTPSTTPTLMTLKLFLGFTVAASHFSGCKQDSDWSIQTTGATNPTPSPAATPEAGAIQISTEDPNATTPKTIQKGITGFTKREVTIIPGFSQEKPTIKVPLIVDNSGSMSEEQILLATGIDNMVKKFGYENDVFTGVKYNLDFYLYTTTTLPGAVPLPNPLPTLSVSTNKLSVVNSVNTANSLANYNLNPSLLKTGDVTTLSIRMNQELSNQEQKLAFDLARANLKSKIQVIGTSGSGFERGLCSLALLLNPDAPNAILKKGDRVAFLTLTDADNYNWGAGHDVDGCLSSSTSNTSSETDPRTETQKTLDASLDAALFSNLKNNPGESPAFAEVTDRLQILKNRMQYLFNESYFYMAYFDRGTAGSKECTSSERAGTVYGKFMTLLGLKAGSGKICDNNYSLNVLESFIVKTSNNTYTVSLEPGELVEGPQAVRVFSSSGPATGTPLTATQVSLLTTQATADKPSEVTLMFTQGVLDNADKITVEVSKPTL
jgi:hypothetical protein